MSFLKKLGLALAQTAIQTSVQQPQVGSLFSGGTVAPPVPASSELTELSTIIMQTEVLMAGKSGAEKLAAALPLASYRIRASPLLNGKKVINEALFQQGVKAITEGVVNLLNASDEAVKTEPKA